MRKQPLYFERRSEDDGPFCYGVWRMWDKAKHPAAFLLSAPPYAEAEATNQTMRACTAHAYHWGAGGARFLFLSGRRVSAPFELSNIALQGLDFIGDSLGYLKKELPRLGGFLVCCWGQLGTLPALVAYYQQAKTIIRESGVPLFCFAQAHKLGFPNLGDTPVVLDARGTQELRVYEL